jgi:hypothetical protein
VRDDTVVDRAGGTHRSATLAPIVAHYSATLNDDREMLDV